MPTTKELKRLEETLGRSLGFTPYGEPLYKWVRAGSHTMPIIKVDGFGHPLTVWKDWPIYEEQEVDILYADGTPTGKKHLVQGKPTGKRIFKPGPVIEMRKMAEHLLDDQWVLARWFFTKQEDWQRQFFGLLPWPYRGVYYPGNASLPPGEVPNATWTELAIQLISKDRKRTFDDWIAQAENGLERLELLNDNRVDDILRDTITAFGSAKPGAKGGHYSFGGTRDRGFTKGEIEICKS